MTLRSVLIAVTLSFFLFPFIASAQEPAAAATPDEKAEAALEKKVFDLIESIVARAAMLHSLANRVRVESTLVDLYWIKDEKRARAIFNSATQELVAYLSNIDSADPQSQEPLQSAMQLRMEMIDRIARRDPELALSFLRTTRMPKSTGSRYGATDGEAYLEAHLANLIAANDPERALRIARASLARGFSYELTGILSQLQQKDKERAQTLYREIVDKLTNEDLARHQEAANFAVNLLSSFRPPSAGEQTYRQLIETLTSAALANRVGDSASRSFSQNLYNQIRGNMPEIEKYVPSRAAALRQWAQSFERTSDPYIAMYSELNEVSQKGSVEDLLALASKYPPEMQAQVYQRAVWKALSSGDANRARQIAADLISDPAQRRNLLDQIDRQLMWNAVNEGRLAEARQMSSKFATIEEQAQFLTSLANNVAAKGDKKGALGLLDEAESLLASVAQNSNRMNAQMQIALAYSALDLEHSFAIMQPLIMKLNELIAAAVVLDGFENRYLKEGEFVTGAGSVGNLANNIDQNLASLARLDFDRARALSDQLERPEVQLMAQLQIVQALRTEKMNGNCNGCNRPVQRRGIVVLHQ